MKSKSFLEILTDDLTQKLKAELKTQLKAEIKAELKSDLASEWSKISAQNGDCNGFMNVQSNLNSSAQTVVHTTANPKHQHSASQMDLWLLTHMQTLKQRHSTGAHKTSEFNTRAPNSNAPNTHSHGAHRLFAQTTQIRKQPSRNPIRQPSEEPEQFQPQTDLQSADKAAQHSLSHATNKAQHYTSENRATDLTTEQVFALEFFRREGAELRQDFSLSELKFSYRELAKRLHPDCNLQASLSERSDKQRRFQHLTECISLLSTAIEN